MTKGKVVRLFGGKGVEKWIFVYLRRHAVLLGDLEGLGENRKAEKRIE